SETARASVRDEDTVGKVLKFFGAENADDIVDRMLYTDLMTRMPDQLLVTVDRMSMAHSLETRAPLIDHRLVEFAATIPGEMKLRRNRIKHLLRKVSERYLPRELIYRRKQGFGFPLGMWMRGDLRGFVEELIASSRFVEMGIFDPNYMRALLDEHVSGRVDHSYRLWLLVSLEFWYRLKIEQEDIESLSHEIAARRSIAAE
ncbi:MAG: asparagine synthase C-terminal domain-containing protein, partial [Pseudomonadota bacterium]